MEHWKRERFTSVWRSSSNDLLSTFFQTKQHRKVYFKNKAFWKAAGKRAKELKRDRVKHSTLCSHSLQDCCGTTHVPCKKSHYNKDPHSSRQLFRLKIVSLNFVVSNESVPMTALFKPATAKVQHELTPALLLRPLTHRQEAQALCKPHVKRWPKPVVSSQHLSLISREASRFHWNSRKQCPKRMQEWQSAPYLEQDMLGHTSG